MIAAPLFQNAPLTFDEEYSRFRRLIKNKTSEHMVSFGVFSDKKGDDDYNLWMVLTLKSGAVKTFSIKANSMVDMVAKANEFLTNA